MVQWLGFCAFTATAWVQFLVGKLRSRQPCSAAQQTKTRWDWVVTFCDLESRWRFILSSCSQGSQEPVHQSKVTGHSWPAAEARIRPDLLGSCQEDWAPPRSLPLAQCTRVPHTASSFLLALPMLGPVLSQRLYVQPHWW